MPRTMPLILDFTCRVSLYFFFLSSFFSSYFGDSEKLAFFVCGLVFSRWGERLKYLVATSCVRVYACILFNIDVPVLSLRFALRVYYGKESEWISEALRYLARYDLNIYHKHMCIYEYIYIYIYVIYS